MILEQSYNAPLLPVDKNNMNTYPNMLTPPSSNEDSPQPVYFVASPNSSSFHAPEDYATGHIPAFDILPQTQPVVDPNMLLTLPRASLHFIEQPTDRFRFRYKSEMAGTHGSLTGINSDKSRKQTYPTVELKNCTGTAIIRCSIYQLNAQGKDFMPHAHRLIMKKGKEEHDDPHDLVVGPEDDWRAPFHGMGIIHTAKKNIVTELVRKKAQLKMEYIARVEGKYRKLSTKEEVEIKGLAEGESKSINLNIVCLRFDAFIKQNDILFPICEPIYTHGINNLKSALTGELKIVRLDHVTSPAKGGKEIFVLVERVTKKNVKIRFFEVDDKDDEVWSDYGKFNDLDVHHQYAIVFKTPKFRDENITQPIKVYMELVRPSDNAKSEPREFTYVPSNPYKPGSKRPRNEYYSSSSYDSSNIASDELPVVISNLKLEQTQNANVPAQPNIVANSWNAQDQMLTSEELAVAINNIDSDEFKRLFQQFTNDETYPSIATDAPRVPVFWPEMDDGQTRFVTVPRVVQAEMGESRTFPKHRVAQAEMGESRIVPSRVGPRKVQGTMVTVLKRDTHQASLPLRSVIKMEVLAQDRQMASRTLDELKSFAKTAYTLQDAKSIIRYWLGTENRTNALHVFVCQNDVEAAVFVLKLIAVTKQFDLVNIKSSLFQTPLQLAVQCHNATLVSYLVMCKAKVSEINSKVNTALHTAVEENVPIDILEQLLIDKDHEKVKDYIDLTNNDGNTALTIAIENKNVPALKLLCRSGSDINKKSLKTGFTPLRVAIERQYLDIIKYILALPHTDPTIADFKDISPLKAAHQRESSREILEVIEKYMIEHSLEIDIKEEVEDDSDEEMEEDSDVKPEPISPEELKEFYKRITAFTPQCLDEVSAILNESGKWEDLAELLDVSHLLRCGIIATSSNVSKNLLSYAVETHRDTIWEIREFLENLDELRAVEVMDRMVRNLQNN